MSDLKVNLELIYFSGFETMPNGNLEVLMFWAPSLDLINVPLLLYILHIEQYFTEKVSFGFGNKKKWNLSNHHILWMKYKLNMRIFLYQSGYIWFCCSDKQSQIFAA